LPFANFDKYTSTGKEAKIKQQKAKAGGEAAAKLLETNRLILGTRIPGANAETLLDYGDPAGQKLPNAVAVGTVIYQNAAIYRYDQEEFDYLVEHARNQVRDIKNLRDGSAVWGRVGLAYFTSKDDNTSALFGDAIGLWNNLQREYEDFLRQAGGKANGDVSWNFYSTRIPNFWNFYRVAVSPQAGFGGTLGDILTRKMAKKLPVGTYRAAYDKLTEIYNAIPASWADLRTMSNPSNVYRFLSPAGAGNPPPA
jgi:hypothetical protein